jgi:hypothetical protein
LCPASSLNIAGALFLRLSLTGLALEEGSDEGERSAAICEAKLARRVKVDCEHASLRVQLLEYNFVTL